MSKNDVELTVPLFPLHTVLFPGGIVPLRIFEPRYLDMVSHCLRTDSPFGVCLIQEGSELDHQVQIHDTGTLAKIIHWDRRADGLLGIDAQGQQRFRVLSRRTLSNQLIEARVKLLADDPVQELPHLFEELADILAHLLKQLDKHYCSLLNIDYRSANWVSHRLSELLPLPLKQRQQLLELDNALKRLVLLQESVAIMKLRG
ncbi:LON peptidase substrate-binding domain-containing protein [Thioflexithrix psekupsensis]|uniref:Peptidase S16 n=1 Tax=Thioflexithrix psekupsensis TaxID=1570016 RepID=A0A251X8X3_9GAMM|nr:LON peptidase substrate-binding domain-containing protein [Thioflexithrix psekupsensis]OUD14385.1 peptidase S16 [Thioflexithrix psekupsensis]